MKPDSADRQSSEAKDLVGGPVNSLPENFAASATDRC
jgi:hypothetical protein